MKFLVSIYDTLAGIHSTIHTVANAAIALRDFSDAVNDPNSPLKKHAKDYQLELIGEIDEETSELKNYAENVILAKAIDLLPTRESEKEV